MVNGFKKTIGALAGMAILATLLFFSDEIRAGTLRGLHLAGTRVVPSLFLFSVASELFLRFELDGPIRRVLGPTFERVFHLPRCVASAWVIGIVAGYPLGAKAVSDLCASGKITRSDGDRAVGLCSSCGIAFTVAVVRPVLFLSGWKTAALYGIHLTAGILAYLPLRGNSRPTVKTEHPYRAEPRFAPLLSDAVGASAFTMVKLTGFLCLFCALMSLLPVIPEGLLELSAGIDSLRPGQAMLAALYMGLGGVCVWCQTASVTGPSGIRLGRFCLFKLLQGALAAGMTYVILK